MFRLPTLRAVLTVAASSAAFLLAGSAYAAPLIVSSFLPGPVPPVPAANQWYISAQAGAGTAGVVNLKGVGGNLENNQPLPTGAALLTTGFSNADRAEVGTFQDFGLASSLLNTLSLSYKHFNQAQAGQNIFAAPALKLSIFAPGGSGDNFGQLVYEPYFNNGVAAVPRGDWLTENITPTTGQGADGSGGWWWTGGFEIPSGAGGPPVRSLAEWAAAFAGADPDFANARVTGISLGVGTYNLGQIGYFDEVAYTLNGVTTTYDFDFEVIPEPSSLLVMVGLLAAAGGVVGSRRRGR